MKRTSPTAASIALALAACGQAAAAAETAPADFRPPAVCPAPKQVRFEGAWELPAADACAIHIGPQATQPEVYAAERLARDIRRRFKLTIEIVKGDALPQGKSFVAVLGTAKGNPLVAKFAAERKLAVDETGLGGKTYSADDRAGLDGYVIETFGVGKVRAVLVAGVNGRGVIYGADTLFQLLRRRENGVELARAAVRDWASIPWRGSVSSLTPSAEDDPDHDARIRARLNFTDTRYPGGLWLYPGKLTKDLCQRFRRSVAEAHRRGMLVYAHMISSEKSGRSFRQISADFEKMLALGADGMWIGYDDAGGGSDPIGTGSRLMALAAARGLSGRRIAHTPPSSITTVDGEPVTGNYHRLAGAQAGHARFIAAVAGMDTALYYITSPPTPGRHKIAKAVGLAEGKYAWWHNWPRYPAGLLHTSYGGSSLRPGGAAAYYGMVPLSVGWHRPNPANLRDAGRQISAVWLNACTGRKQVEYLQSVLGFWAWSPERYDWPGVRRAIHGYVFGPAQAAPAGGFDAGLARVTKRVVRIGGKRGPAVLGRRADAPALAKTLQEMDKLLKIIAPAAAGESMIDPARLERLYLEPMRATVAHIGKVVDLSVPEVSPEQLDKRMIALLDAGRQAEAEQALRAVSKKVLADVARIKEALSGDKHVDAYVKGWEQRLSGMDYWEGALAAFRAERARQAEKEARRRAEDMRKIPVRFKQLVRGDFARLLAGLARPPAGKCLAEVRPADWSWPTDPPCCNGPWGIGRYASTHGTCVAIAYPDRTGSRAGFYAEVRAELTVPKFQSRLTLDAFVNDNRAIKTTGYWFTQLWVNEQMVWEEDVAASRAGKEWLSIDVSAPARKAPKLRLRFRVHGRRGVSNYGLVAFLGPVRLLGE